MAQELTPKIIAATDTPIFDAGGQVRRVMRVQYMLGSLGPFTHDFDPETFSDFEARQVIEKRAASLRGLA